ncbi:MAG: hypothetical protein IJN92_10720 [Lachnospiraceae bacterium]|nr:hypothetical protein [Lachnospiraceae bacterium]
MKIEKQYSALLELEKEINERLKKNDFVSIKELILWLAKSSDFQKLKKKENSLIMLDAFCGIWLEEMKQLPDWGILDNIFSSVSSLNDIEERYQNIKFLALRVENNVPEEFCIDLLDKVIEQKISGIAIGRIVISETLNGVENILKIARLLKEKMQLITAILMLEYTHKGHPENDDILLEMAGCWMEGQQWEKTLECLLLIKKPDPSVKELIQELEKMINHETI